MKILKNKKFIALLGLVLLLWCGMIGIALAVNDVASGSKTGTWLTGKLSYSFTSTSEGTSGNGAKGTVSASGSTLTVNATSSKYVSDRCNGDTSPYSTTTTVTVKNISDFPLRVDSLSGDTDAIQGVGEGSTIGVGGSFTITVTSTPSSTTAGSETATAKITISVTEMKSVNITAAASPYVDYTLNGKTVSKGGSDVTFETDAGTTISLPAITAPAGYEFAGWRIGSKPLTTDSSFTVDGNYTVYPAIVAKGATDGKYFKVGNTQYTFWEEAVDAAVNASNKQIILVADCTLPDTVLDNAVAPSGGTYVQNDGSGHPVYLIPSGVIFIAPYAENYKYVTGTGKTDHTYACEDQSAAGNGGVPVAVGEKVYAELTVPSGATVNLESGSVLSVGGTTNGSEVMTGAHANIHLEADAKIYVKSGAVLSVCGYIYGEGTVTAESSSTVYVPFSINDFRGGGYTVGVAGQLAGNYGISSHPSGEKGLSPFIRYTINAIQTELILRPGAAVTGYMNLAASSENHNIKAALIGASDGLIKVGSGTAVTITYDADTYASTYASVGKTKIAIDGSGEFGNLVMTQTVGSGLLSVTATIDTAKVNFPLPYNFDIEIVSGTFNIPNSLMLLPGASVTVDKGATLNVNSNLTVYDGLHDYTANPSGTNEAVLSGYQSKSSKTTAVSPYITYPTTAVLQGASFGGSGSADLIVNGTMNLNKNSSFGGVVQTSSSGAARIVVASSGVGTSTTTQIGAAGTYNVLSKDYGFAGATTRTIQGEILDTGTGKRTNLVAGQTYKPAAGTDNISEYTYTLYYDSSQKNEPVTEAVACILQGSWWNYEVDVYMVLDGQESGSVKMYFAHGAALPEGYYYDKNKASPATSVTNGNTLYFIGESEAEIIRADGSGTIKYPSVRNAVKDVNVGDTIKLLKDLEDFSSIIGPEAGQDFTFDMNKHSINYRSTPFTSSGGIMTVNMNGGKITNVVGEKHYDSPAVLMNNSQGSITLNLNGGEISVTGTAGAPLTNGGVENGGNLTIDLGGGKWEYLTGLAVPTASNDAGTQHHDLTVMAAYQNKAMFNNAGTLTIKDTGGGGSVTTDLISNGTTLTATTPTTNYVSVIRNQADATLVLDGGTFILDPSGDVNGDAVLSTAATPTPMAVYSSVVLNFGDIKSSGEGSAVSLIGSGGYSLYNFKGGTVDLDLKGGTIELAEYEKGTAINAAMYNSKYVVVNDGEMTLKSSEGHGKVIMSVQTTTGALSGILNSNNAAIFSTLTLDGIDIEVLHSASNSSYGVYNRAGSNITGITNTSVEVGLGNALSSAGSLTTTTAIGDITGSSFKASAYGIYLSYTETGAIEDCQLTASKLGNNSGALHVINYSSVDYVKNTDIVSEDTATTTNNTAYGIYTTNSKFGDITGVNITVAKGGGIYAAGTAENINTPVDRVLATFGDITDTVITTQTAVGVNISHTEIGDLDHVTITTVTGNGITATNGCEIGDITDCEITAPAAGGLSTASFTATAAAPNSIAPTVGNVTDTTINAKTFCFSISGIVANAYDTDGARATVGVIEDCKFYSVAPAANTGVIVNANSSIDHILRTELVMTAPTVNTSYGIYNNGGAIGYIEKCEIDANAGIYNRNTTSVAYNAAGGSGAVIGFYGNIGAIKDTDITVGQYAINNGGVIDEISGKCTLVAAPASAQVPRASGTAALNGNNPGYTVYNSNQWWGTTNIWWRNDDASSGHMVRTDEYKMEDAFRPTIGKITGDVKIIALNTSTSNAHGVALYNAGVINEISGNVKIDTHVHENTTAAITLSQYAIQNTTGGRIDLITDNVTISAGQNALWNGSQATTKQVTHYFEATATTINTQETEYLGSEIKEISGNVTIEATAGQYGIANYREIREISGNVSISAATTYALGNVFSEGNHYKHILQVRDSGTTNYTQTKEYEFDQAHIGTIGSDVKIHSGGNYAVYNHGQIDTLSAEISTDAQYGVATVSGHAETRKTMIQGTAGGASSETNVYYTYYAPTITTIDGARITAGTSYGIKNVGIIESITNTSVITGTERAISNDAVYTVRNDYELTWNNDGTTKPTVKSVTKATNKAPEIGLIGAGNSFSSTKNTIYNSGEITAIGGEERTTIKAATGVAVYNYQGLAVSKNGDKAYVPAHIGTINNVGIDAATYGIQNGDGNASYVGVTIDEIGEGTEITATGNHAVYNYNANSVIQTITGGIFTTESNGAKVYALYNNSTANPILISGGDFKSGSNDRAHAIYLPDDANRYTYPEGMFLRQVTRDVTFANGESGENYYYIDINGFYLIFEGNGATEGEMEKQTVSLDDLNAEVTLTANGFTFTLDGEELDFLGWTTVKEASKKELDDAWTGTVKTLNDLLEAALGIEIQAGTEITLYAVWNVEEPSTCEIVWGDLDFTYTRPTYRWDAENMQYVLETAGSWSAADESAPTITVKVVGDAGYVARLSYLNEDGFGFGMTFTGGNDVEVTDNTFTIPGNGEVVVEAMLTGDPGDGSANKTKVGTVTIELTKQESQQTP